MTGSRSNSRSLAVFGFFLFALSLEAQTSRSIPPNLDPSFWGKPHRPYVATIVQTSETTDVHGVRQEHIGRSKYYRDDAGRERSEGFYDSGQLSTAMLRDPSTTKVIMLYAVQRTANVFSVPRPTPPPPGKGWSVESLPSKTILGFVAVGERFIREVPAQPGANTGRVIVTEDTWFSEDLGVVLEEIYDDPRTGIVKKEMTEIDQINPEPGLFAIPSSYVIHETGGFAQ